MKNKKSREEYPGKPADQILQTVQGEFYESIAEVLRAARSNAYRAVNFVMVEAYWNIGRMIVEEEQQGKERAGYGEALLRGLSKRLNEDFGRGFGVSNLFAFRQFYLAFPIFRAVRGISPGEISHRETPPAIGDALRHESSPNPDIALDKADPILHALRAELTWTHYRLLIRVEKPEAREWYMNEAADQNWSTRAMERQINSLYYERLLMSRDKTPVKDEMREKTEPLARLPEDFIKDPYVLEFLGMPDAHQFREADLEQAIIGKLQAFMLELGKGFAFVARQHRISTETKDFFIDLVFYNFILKCFLLIDLKTSELTHEDIGKMDMYPVRYCYEYFSLRLRSPIYKGRQLLCWVLQRSEKKIRPAQRRSSAIYRKSPASRTCLLRSVSLSERRDQAREVSQDRLGQALHQGATRRLSHGVYVRVFEDTVKGKDDNPTVGLILCTDKDHTVVKYSVLNESRQIFASKYRLYLPTEEELRIEIERERALAVREQRAIYEVIGA